MTHSETRTENILVSVQSSYVPERSEPEHAQWFFTYTVRIANEGDVGVQLISRHWIITDGNGQVQEVRGAGVVGEQPSLKPGDHFEYTSICPLETEFGTMQGSYQMISTDGVTFDVDIAPFSLSVPNIVN
ncbi:MAG: Co2+/Mg2+ efflux protein ApaG [Gammaproteobacteria bacterium]|nr:MAG: Co2+/Mg2+ efflux protein ApaG [Gammaproteobacteria bacterium]